MLLGVGATLEPSEPQIGGNAGGASIWYCSDGSVAPGVLFDINQAGGTYYVQVDGDNTGSGAPTGSLTLNWSK